MTEFAASNTGTEAEIADTDRFILEIIGKVVLPFRHGANENTDTFIWCETLNVVFDPDHFSLEAQCDFPAIRRKVIGNGILNDLQELFLRVR